MSRFGAACALVLATAAPALAAPPLANRLGEEPSPYLRSVAASPVAWQPWGEPALRLARDLSRPILLSIGVDWCHWCHVMDRETYAEPAIAAYINAHFVPIKVDRDEDPDVDDRYQRIARASLHTEGWPLTLFLGPDGGLISGGAAFMPDEADGTPGFRALLPRVVALAGEPRSEARTAQTVMQAPGGPARLSPAVVDGVVAATLGEFDVIYGGFGQRDKRVPTPLLALLARRHAETGDPRLREVLTRTLDAMANGAIRDQLGGGFFGGTADRAWRAPDFEQLEVIQAQAIVAYLLGYQATGAPRYRAVAEELLAFVGGTLARRGGGFNASRRADPEHYRWSEADVRAALPTADADLLVRHFGLAGVTERRALRVDADAESLAADARVPLASMEQRLRAAKDRLRQARDGRGQPAVDDTVYADRSARLASAYLEAYKVLGGDERLAVALETLEFLQTMRQADGGLAHAVAAGRVIAAGSLDDQLAPAAALLDAFEITGTRRYLDSARALVAHALDRFRRADGGFVDHAADDRWPGGNALAAVVLERLSALTNEPSYRARAREALAATPAPPPGPAAATFAYAVDLVLNGAPHVVVAGSPGDARTRDLWRGALRAFRPGKIVERYDPGTSDLATVPPAVAAVLRQQAEVAEPRAYVCSGTVCSLPERDPERLRELVERLGRRR